MDALDTFKIFNEVEIHVIPCSCFPGLWGRYCWMPAPERREMVLARPTTHKR
jgi:hypothetical protein